INQTTYTVENRLLSSNTALTALDGSGIIVDHPSLILSGFDDTVTIAEVLIGVRCDTTAYINVIDAGDRLVPLLSRTMDSAVTEPLATRVYKGLFFEVVAEDGSRASYALIPSANASDAYLSSNIFTVNQQDKSITGATREHSAATLLPYLYPSGNASMKLKRKNGFERASGLLHAGDYVMVTSEDKTDSTRYDILLDGESIMYLSIKKSIFIMSVPPKTAKVGSNYNYTLKTSGDGILSFESLPGATWLSLQDGVLKGIPESTDEGLLEIMITYASEEDTSIQAFSLTVLPDIPLTITSSPVQRAYTGETYLYAITTTGTGTLSFDNDVMDAWIEWLTLEGNLLTGTPSSDDVGSFEAHITFENELESTNQVFTLTVAERIPLEITSTPGDSISAGETYSYLIETVGEGALSFESSPETDWLDLEDHILTGTPGNDDAGTVDVTLAYSNEADTVTQAFTITIVTAVSYGPGARTGQVLLWPNPASGHIHISRLPLGATIELISA
ncbi:MAG: hypothetical protein GY790_00455, partial [Bacteroidetes bacterium]|nr:hypothetical protein [Bacteroidota bacterium]